MSFHSKDRGRTAENSLMRRGFLTLPLLAALLFAGCSSLRAENEEPVKSDLFAMDTYMTFTAYGDGAEQALGDIEERIKELEGEWSVTDEGSEIYRVNHSGGAPVELGADTAGIVRFALEMAEETGGALDPTIYPVLTAWGFTTDENRIPSQEEIDSLLEHVGYEKVKMFNDSIQYMTSQVRYGSSNTTTLGYESSISKNIITTDNSLRITAPSIESNGTLENVYTKQECDEKFSGGSGTVPDPLNIGQVTAGTLNGTNSKIQYLDVYQRLTLKNSTDSNIYTKDDIKNFGLGSIITAWSGLDRLLISTQTEIQKAI